MSSNVLEFNEFKILLATLCVRLGFFLALYAVHRFSMVLASYSFFVKRERWNKWLQVMLPSLLIS